MKKLCSAVLLVAFACSSPDAGHSAQHATPSPAAQSIVDRVASKNADVARLSIHSVDAGGKSAHIVASTVKGRIGDASDPEDFEAIKSGQAVVMSEGRNVDYTLPVKDDAGATIAIVGLTISGASGGSHDALVARAKQLANEIAGEIRTQHKAKP